MKTIPLLFLSTLFFCVTANAAPATIGGPIINAANGHVYYLLALDSWTNAENAAITLGGHLASINDAAEDAWVYSRFSSYGGVKRTLWIGLNDAVSEGTYVWSSGEPVTFTRWGPGEPDNLGNEDFGCYFPPEHQYGGTWNDCTWAAECNGVVEVIRTNSGSCVPVPEGLVSWWTGNGTANDLTGTNHGAIVGASFENGRYGQAFSFDGVNDGINVSESPSLMLTQSLTIEGWIYIVAYPTDANSFGVASILFRGDDRPGRDPYHMTLRSSRIEFSVNSADEQFVQIGAPISTGQWVHAAATLDDATGAMKIYLNGVVAVETNTNIRPLGPLDPFSNAGIGIGNVQGLGVSGFRFPFHGLIDNLRLYSRALSSDEIQSIYNASGTCVTTLDIAMYAGLTVSGSLGSLVQIEYREALGSSNDWKFLTNFTLISSPYLFFDAGSSVPLKRFYRAVVAP